MATTIDYERDCRLMVPRKSVKPFIHLVKQLRKICGSRRAASKLIGVHPATLDWLLTDNILSYANGKRILATFKNVMKRRANHVIEFRNKTCK